MAFGRVEKEVVTDPALSLEAKGLYALLSTYADQYRKCYPAIETLVDLSGKSRRTVFRLLDELEEAGYVTRKRRSGASTLYTLR